MSNWFLETGLYLLGAALIPAVGLLLACWGIWGDRSKGRSRCPKCWYDMRGSLPKLTCPECGHDAREKRQLYKNRRRWRRMALGVALVLLCSYPLTIAGGWYREQACVRELTKRGHSAGGSVRTGPDWLVGLLPEGFARLFDRIWTARLGVAGTDADLAECGKLRRLLSLDISHTRVTDAGLVHLKGLSQLRWLDLSGRQVTDAGLVHLKGLSQLRFLALNRTFRQLGFVQGLDPVPEGGTTYRTGVTDAGITHLKGLSQLRKLDLTGTQVTDAGLVHLKGLSYLELLYLTDTNVSDAGLVHLRGLTQLQELHLEATQVTDGGLVHLKGLSQLQSLLLHRTQVTGAGRAKLKQALPKLSFGFTSSYRRVNWNPPQQPPPNHP